MQIYHVIYTVSIASKYFIHFFTIVVELVKNLMEGLSGGHASNFDRVCTKKLVSVEYPGYIKNVDKMLATIGGEENISQTYFKSKCRLQLSYRPEDIFSHNVCADLLPCTGILIKVRRRRVKKSDSPCDKDEIRQEIVGVVSDEYRMASLMDYQYLAPKEAWGLFDTIHDSELGRKDVPPFFPPATFARIDTCGNYNYRPNPETLGKCQSKSLNDTFTNKNLSEQTNPPRKKRHSEAKATLYHIENVPCNPTEMSVATMKKIETTADAPAIETIRQLFEERPLWSRLAITCHVKVSIERLKKILSYFAYYWLSGPWRTMWCRLGYDPRKDPSAKIYQMVEFRVRESAKTKGIFSLIQPKRSTKSYIPRNLQLRSKGFGTSALATKLQNQDDDQGLNQSTPYIFRSDEVPGCRNQMFQLCDVYDDDVQEIVNGDKYVDKQCKEREGWYVAGTMALIRQLMTKAVVKLLEQEKLKRKGLVEENRTDESNDTVDEEPIDDRYDGDDAETDGYDRDDAETFSFPMLESMENLSNDSFGFLQLMRENVEDDSYMQYNFDGDDFIYDDD